MKYIAYLCAALGLLFFIETLFHVTSFTSKLSSCEHKNYVEVHSINPVIDGRRMKCESDVKHEFSPFSPGFVTTFNNDVCKELFGKENLFDGDGGLYFEYPGTFGDKTTTNNEYINATLDELVPSTPEAPLKCHVKCQDVTLNATTVSTYTDVRAYKAVSLKETGWSITYYIATSLAIVSSLILAVICFVFYLREKIVRTGFDMFLSYWLMIHAVVDAAVTIMIPILLGLHVAARNDLEAKTDIHKCRVDTSDISYFTMDSKTLLQNYFVTRAFFLILFAYRSDQYSKGGLVQASTKTRASY